MGLSSASRSRVAVILHGDPFRRQSSKLFSFLLQKNIAHVNYATLEQVISQSTDLISQARASLERDKKLIEKSIDLMSRSFILLKQLSAAMELNERLEAQLAGMEPTP